MFKNGKLKKKTEKMQESIGVTIFILEKLQKQ